MIKIFENEIYLKRKCKFCWEILFESMKTFFIHLQNSSRGNYSIMESIMKNLHEKKFNWKIKLSKETLINSVLNLVQRKIKFRRNKKLID